MSQAVSLCLGGQQRVLFPCPPQCIRACWRPDLEVPCVVVVLHHLHLAAVCTRGRQGEAGTARSGMGSVSAAHSVLHHPRQLHSIQRERTGGQGRNRIAGGCRRGAGDGHLQVRTEGRLVEQSALLHPPPLLQLPKPRRQRPNIPAPTPGRTTPSRIVTLLPHATPSATFQLRLAGQSMAWGCPLLLTVRHTSTVSSWLGLSGLQVSHAVAPNSAFKASTRSPTAMSLLHWDARFASAAWRARNRR